MNDVIQKLYAIDKELKILEHTGALLGWDQETGMPDKAVEERGDQVALIESIAHKKNTSDEVRLLLEKMDVKNGSYTKDEELTEKDKAFIRQFNRNYEKRSKLPESFVTEFAKTATAAQGAWVKAKEESDFKKFAPYLKKLLELSIQKAELYGYVATPYDALLDDYEPYMTTKEVDSLFGKVENALVPFVASIKDADQVDNSFIEKDFDIKRQEEFSRFVLHKIGFPLDRGRLDISAHPFTTTLGKDDVRITTRYRKNFFNTSIFGTIHECGHALYELGFPEEYAYSCLADCVSLGIHESQSRTWENQIGRSMDFWKYFYPVLQSHFHDNLQAVSLEQFYKGINKVAPTFIRVDADEVTYSLHIILRFNLEQQLIANKLSVDDLPDAWNSMMQQYLGITPENDGQGVLQDIHWAFGGFGYFPTYALGNLYSSQFFAQMKKDLPNMESLISSGDFNDILGWLRKHIHSKGSSVTARQLCLDVTGEKLNPQYYIDYIQTKYSDIYGI